MKENELTHQMIIDKLKNNLSIYECSIFMKLCILRVANDNFKVLFFINNKLYLLDDENICHFDNFSTTTFITGINLKEYTNFTNVKQGDIILKKCDNFEMIPSLLDDFGKLITNKIINL